MESARHRLSPVDIAGGKRVDGDAHAVRRPPTVLAPGELEFAVIFTSPPGVLQVVAQAASCDDGAEHPVCRITRQDWGVPVRLDGDGERTLNLMMAGTPSQ